jgi:acetate kinase
MEPGLLVINAGSSSIKFAGYVAGGELVFLGRGQVESLGVEPRFVCKDAAGAILGEHQWSEAITYGEAIDYIIGWIEARARNGWRQRDTGSCSAGRPTPARSSSTTEP